MLYRVAGGKSVIWKEKKKQTFWTGAFFDAAAMPLGFTALLTFSDKARNETTKVQTRCFDFKHRK